MLRRYAHLLGRSPAAATWAQHWSIGHNVGTAHLFARSPATASLRRASLRRHSSTNLTLQVEHQERTHEVVVTAAGPDRLGIVNEVTRAIVSIGGNVGESQSMSVRGTFMAAFAIELDVHVDLTEFCSDVTNQLPGFMVSLQPAASAQAADAPTYTARVVVSMADHIGAVHEVSSVFAQQRLNVVSLKTMHETAPLGGTELFGMEGALSSTEPIDVIALSKALAALEEKRGIDVVLYIDDEAQVERAQVAMRELREKGTRS